MNEAELSAILAFSILATFHVIRSGHIKIALETVTLDPSHKESEFLKGLGVTQKKEVRLVFQNWKNAIWK